MDSEPLLRSRGLPLEQERVDDGHDSAAERPELSLDERPVEAGRPELAWLRDCVTNLRAKALEAPPLPLETADCAGVCSSCSRRSLSPRGPEVCAHELLLLQLHVDGVIGVRDGVRHTRSQDAGRPGDVRDEMRVDTPLEDVARACGEPEDREEAWGPHLRPASEAEEGRRCGWAALPPAAEAPAMLREGVKDGVAELALRRPHLENEHIEPLLGDGGGTEWSACCMAVSSVLTETAGMELTLGLDGERRSGSGSEGVGDWSAAGSSAMQPARAGV